MTNKLRTNLNNLKPVPGEHGAPAALDEYADWFNASFKFARAEIITPKDGRRFIEIRYR